jgi:hypothetical protein
LPNGCNYEKGKEMQREVISGAPTEEYDRGWNSGGTGEADYQKVDRTEERIISETEEYRMIEVTEYVSWGKGGWSQDVVSSGGGEGGEFTNVYRVKEWL